jgi:hypothetical protein
MPALLSRREEAHAIRLAKSQPESLVELARFAETLRVRAVEVAINDLKVRARLEGVRYRVLAVDYREQKGEDSGLIRLGDVCIYDYDHDVLVVASVDPRAGDVVNLIEREGAAPPISEDERKEALRLAAEARPGGKALPRNAAGSVAFPSPSYAFDAQPARRGHRGCTLFFRSARDGVGAITVDLSAREVVPEELMPEVLRSRPARGAGPREGASNAR